MVAPISLYQLEACLKLLEKLAVGIGPARQVIQIYMNERRGGERKKKKMEMFQHYMK